MINFDEELKRFEPSPEVEDMEQEIYNHDMKDMVDIMIGMMSSNNASNSSMNGGMGQF